jgi:hypothetical protein
MTSRAEKVDRYPNKININVYKIQNLVRIEYLRKEKKIDFRLFCFFVE